MISLGGVLLISEIVMGSEIQESPRTQRVELMFIILQTACPTKKYKIKKIIYTYLIDCGSSFLFYFVCFIHIAVKL